ncbi:hypothetical protein CAEBREN_19680 [Caenorhabditis brenneri]|uniref:F-box domain-containing protein n=1 Tax=Caenorhabditis brenneri TaxID=135651 RepID=G0MJH3_CAEBE|nr:hypothetical protein CAEBREN_19680 [Caenorhabditis brenneri]
MPRRLFSPFHSLRLKKYKRANPSNPPEIFPFLKLPHFPLKYVINQMEFIDVIHLTMKCKRFKRAVESAKFHVDQLHFHLGKWYKNIVVTHQGQELEIEVEYREGGYGSTGLKLNGVDTPISYWRSTDMKVFAESEEVRIDVLDKITQHLLRILWVQKFTARFNIKIDYENLFIWNYTRKLGKFKIEPLAGSEIVVSPKELHFLLEEIKIDDLELDLKVEDGYRCPKYPLQGSKVHIHNNGWIDFDKLTIGPDCVQFTFHQHNTTGNFWMPNTCGNRLLKEWIAGKNDKLEEMTFQVKDFFFGPENNADLFEGITTTVNTFSQKQLDKRGVWRHGLRVPIIDIKRSTDGRLATISRWKWWVYIYVWHPKHIDELKDVVEPVVEDETDEEMEDETEDEAEDEVEEEEEEELE